jgi:hypothetical protein
MSRIQDLKKLESNNINIIDILSSVNPTKKSKYVETLLRLVNNKKKDIHRPEYISELVRNYKISEEFLNGLNNLQLLTYYSILTVLLHREEIEIFTNFCELNERELIEENDLTKYKTFDHLAAQLSIAELKVSEKEMEGCVIKIHEDNEWLIVRPLTFAASKKYGSFTRWCTTTRDNPDYFFRYCDRGALIYTINKKTGERVACFKSFSHSDPEFSFWNSADLRVDSLECGLPIEILNLIVKDLKENPVTNFSYLTDEQRIKEEKLIYENRKVSSMVEEAVPQRTMRIVEDDEIMELLDNENYENIEANLTRA